MELVKFTDDPGVTIPKQVPRNNWSFLHSLLSSSAMILLVWSANGDDPFQGKFQVNLLNGDTYRCNIILRTNRVRCTLSMEILDLRSEETFLERAVVELV